MTKMLEWPKRGRSRPPNSGLWICRNYRMNDDLAKLAGEIILDLIRQNERQLGWHEVAQSLSADESAERAEIYLALRAIERQGVIGRSCERSCLLHQDHRHGAFQDIGEGFLELALPFV
jgi:hypothetical protein